MLLAATTTQLSELPHQLTPFTPLVYGRHKEKIMKWWHASKFYTGNKERSWQILISQVNVVITFVAQLVSLGSYTGVGA